VLLNWHFDKYELNLVIIIIIIIFLPGLHLHFYWHYNLFFNIPVLKKQGDKYRLIKLPGTASNVTISICFPTRKPSVGSWGTTLFSLSTAVLPIPQAELSQARVFSRWLLGIVGSNPACGMEVCLL
jgi:hypothetical protein